MSTRHLRTLLNLLVILGLLLPTGAISMASAPQTKPAPLAPGAPAPDSGLYRTRITVAQPHDWTRLQELGIRVLEGGQELPIVETLGNSALVLVDAEQLETLASLRFQPQASDELNTLLQAQGEQRAWLRASMQPLVEQGAALQSMRAEAELGDLNAQAVDFATAELRAALQALSPEQTAAVADSISPDSDGDGLTDTEEAWWCTDPMNQNSDGDAQGYTDGQEVNALLDFTLSRLTRWSYGPPFGPPAAWPDFNNRDSNVNTPACNDGDFDTIPDFAEAYMVGTRVGTGDSENTDGDKFDDGQELFGTTFCPGGTASCGWGNYPRTQDYSFITSGMPSWIRPPGDSPFVAAYPVIDFLVDPETIEVTTKEIRTIERTITQGEEISTGFAETQGNSTTVGTIDSNEHSTWQENSKTEGGIEPVGAVQSAATATDIGEWETGVPSLMREATPQPPSEPLSATDIERITQTVQDIPASDFMATVDGYDPFRLDDLNGDGDWALLGLASYPTQPDPLAHVIMPRVLLAVAHRAGNGKWFVYLENEPGFRDMLTQLPSSVLAERGKEILLSVSGSEAAISAVTTYSVRGLPWKAGTAWRYNQAPHGNENGWDFGTPNRKDSRGNVIEGDLPATIYGADTGVVVNTGATCILVRRGIDGLMLGYQHIQPEDVANWRFGAVSEYNRPIGETTKTAGCGGTSSGHHVHFYLNPPAPKIPVPGQFLTFNPEGSSLDGWRAVGKTLVKGGATVVDDYSEIMHAGNPEEWVCKERKVTDNEVRNSAPNVSTGNAFTKFVEVLKGIRSWFGGGAGDLVGASDSAVLSSAEGQANKPLDYSSFKCSGQCGGNCTPTGSSDAGVGGGGSGLAINDDGGGSFSALRVWSETTTTGEGWSTSHSELRTETAYSEITRSESHTLVSSEAWSTATTTDPTDAAALTFNYNLYNTGSDAAVHLTGIKINILIGDLPAITQNLPDSFDILPGQAKGPFGSGQIKLTLDQLAAIDNGAPIRVVLADYGYDDNLYDANAWGRSVLFHVDDGTADGDQSIDTYLVTTNLVQNETYQDTLARYFPVTTFQGEAGDERNGTLTGIRTPEFAPDGDITGWNDHPVNEHGWWELSISLGGETDGVKHFKQMPAKPKKDVYLRYVLDTDADGYTDRAERDASTDPADPQSHPKPLLAVSQHTSVSGDTATVQVSLQNEGNFDASSVELWAIAPDDSITINDNLVGGGGRVRAGRQVVLGARIGKPDLSQWTTSRAKPYPDGQFEGASAETYAFRADGTGNVGTTAGLTISWSTNGGASWTPLAVGAGYSPWSSLPLSDGLTIAFSGDYIAQGETFSFDTALPIDTFSYTINRTPSYSKPLIIVSYNDPEGNHKFASDVELAHIQDDLTPYLGRMRYGFQMDVMANAPYQEGANTAFVVFNNPSEQTIYDANIFVEFATPDGTVAKEYAVSGQTFYPGPNTVEVNWSTADFAPSYDPAADYHMLAFAADRQGTIFENTVKDLDQVGHDKLPLAILTDSVWDFGTAQQGTLMSHPVAVGNIGYHDLLTFVENADGLSLSAQGSRTVVAGDLVFYDLMLNTGELAVGPFTQSVKIRTSDPQNPTKTMTIQGNITPMPEDAPGGATIRPLDYTATIASGTQGQWVEFTHNIDPGSAQTLHPVKVYSQDYGTLKGAGKYATDFGQGTASYDMFGDGRDGVLPPSGNMNDEHGSAIGTVNGAKDSTSITVVDRVHVYRIQPGDVVLIHQTQGTGAGNWELNKAVSDFNGNGTFTLEKPLANTYTTDTGANRAQIVRVPQYSTCNVTGTVTPLEAWNGSWGGILAVMCNNTMNVTGELSVSGLGFRKGTGVTGQGGIGGEGIAGRSGTGGRPGVAGTVPGGGGRSGQADTTGVLSGGSGLNNGGGGGGSSYDHDGDSGGGGGGGGGHLFGGGGGGGGRGSDGSPSTGGSGGSSIAETGGGGGGGGGLNNNSNLNGGASGQTGGNDPGDTAGGPGGSTSLTGSGGSGTSNALTGNKGGGAGGGGGGNAGQADLAVAVFGGGGGAGGGRDNPGRLIAGADGGNGGGLIVLGARQITLSGNITSNGSTGANSTDGDAQGSGGGGAGGSILVLTEAAGLGANRITATGGVGGTRVAAQQGLGGQGSPGRIRVEYCESVSGSTNPPASENKLNCYIAEQVESTPYANTRFNLPESGANTYQIQYGRKYDFATPTTIEQTIHLPKQLYGEATLDVLVSNTGVASGDLNLALDIGADSTIDWSRNESMSFPAAFDDQDFTAALNAYLVSRTDVAWNTELDVPFKLTSNRQAQVLLTDMKLAQQFNQPGTLQAADVDVGADRPLDVPVVITGSHSQNESHDFLHTLGPDAASLHPCKVYDQGASTVKGVGKYCTDFGTATMPYSMFGDGRDGSLTVAADTTDSPIDSACSGTAGSHTLAATNAGFAAGQTVLIHQTRGTNAGIWMRNKIVSSSGGTLTLDQALNADYTTGAQVLVLKQYTDVIVNTGVSYRAKAWNGTVGGILALLARDSIVVAGAIDATGKGFRAGAGGARSTGSGNPAQMGHQGEGTSSFGSNTYLPNGNGGGGGGNYYGTSTQTYYSATGGAGGGNGTPGQDGHNNSQDVNPYVGLGGYASGNSELALMTLGGGGGGGGGGKYTGATGQAGGNGGGIVYLVGRTVSLAGSIRSNGTNGLAAIDGNDNVGGGGGGGAGGSVLMAVDNAILTSSPIVADGGVGGLDSGNNPVRSGGGNGGSGRIHVEYCQTISGISSPLSQKVTCYIAEQVETSPYNLARLILPESFSNGRTYIAQFGRRYVFSAAGQDTKELRLKRQVYSAASLDALVSNTGVSSGNLNLCLDIGNDGVCDFTRNANTTFPAELPVTGLVNALNTYLLSRTDIAWGSNVDVPVRVQVDQKADVMLTNLALTPVGAKTRFLRLPARNYDAVTLSLQLGQAGDPAGALAFTLDVGADGSVDWSYSGSHSYPATLASPDLAAAFNAYLAGRTGEVDVPIRIVPSPSLSSALHSFSATPSALPDVSIGIPDIDFGFFGIASFEGSIVPIEVTLHNTNAVGSGPLTVSFFATPPEGFGETYIGAAFVEDVPVGGVATTSLQWNTLGFTGIVPVRAVVDAFDRLDETNESNNQATASITILTRPDLHVPQIELSDAEPLAGEAVSVTLPLRNEGQTAAVASALEVKVQKPDDTTEVLCTPGLAVGGGGVISPTCTWTPTVPGLHRLYAASDLGDVVDESDEGNNLAWRDVYVGLAMPVQMDSGDPGASDDADVGYASEQGYGYLDGSTIAICGDTPEGTHRYDTDLDVNYQFDHLLPGHFYHLDVTFFECDAAGRQQRILVNDQPISDYIDLSDGQVHYESLLLDPALYRSRQIKVTIEASGQNAPPYAIVSAISLHDVDFRYADAGGANDPAYPYLRPGSDPSHTFGWLDGVAQTSMGKLPYQSRRLDIFDRELRYRFDGLDPLRRYELNFTFYQNGGASTQRILINGVDTGVVAQLNGLQQKRLTVSAPPSAYQVGPDHSIVATIRRTDSPANAFVNEISLEQLTELLLPQIANVRIANVTDGRAAISWVTDRLASGEVHFGAAGNLSTIVQDVRGSQTRARSHYVQLQGLAPNTTYQFIVVSADSIDNNAGALYQFTTGPTLALPNTGPAYGRVLDTDGVTLAAGEIAYVTIVDDDGQGTAGSSAPLAALVNEAGFWSVDLGSARASNLTGYFSYSPDQDRIRVEIQRSDGCGAVSRFVPQQARPGQDIYLTCPGAVEHQINAGWTSTAPNLDIEPPIHCRDAMQEIAQQGGTANEIDRWHNGGWETCLLTPAIGSYPLELGKGYFFKATSYDLWQRYGRKPGAPVPVTLPAGWSFIGLPRLPRPMTAADLLADIEAQGGECSQVARWLFGSWDIHIKGVPIGLFSLRDDEGYFVRCEHPGEVIYTPGRGLAAGVTTQSPARASLALPAADHPAITDVQTTNLRDVAFTVTWRTDQASSGRIEFGAGGAFDRVAYDDRGQEAVSTLHHVTLSGLTPQTAYSFRIHSGETVADDGGQPFQVTTPPTGEILPPFTAYGQVADESGPVQQALLRAWLRSEDGADTGPLSALIGESGYWALSLPLASCEQMTLHLTVIDAQGNTGVLEAPACNVQPAPTIVLSHSPGVPIFLPFVTR